MLLAVNTLANIGRFILVLIIFVFVLFLTYFTTRFIANIQQTKIVNSNIKVLETNQIAPNKYIQLVSVGMKYYAIAVSKDNVTLLGELSSEDVDLNALKDVKAPSFKEIIEMAKKKADKLPDNSDSDNSDSNNEEEPKDCAEETKDISLEDNNNHNQDNITEDNK